MQRRRFMQAAFTVAVATSLPAVCAATSGHRQPETRKAFNVGDRFRSEGGTLLVVSEVGATRKDAQYHQYEVSFAPIEGATLVEGTHVLTGLDGNREVFMQPTATGLSAHFSHLI